METEQLFESSELDPAIRRLIALERANEFVHSESFKFHINIVTAYHASRRSLYFKAILVTENERRHKAVFLTSLSHSYSYSTSFYRSTSVLLMQFWKVSKNIENHYYFC
jgi:hypothetical protein